MESGSGTDGVLRLASGKCVPCNDAKPFTVEEATERLKDLPGWVMQSDSILKSFGSNPMSRVLNLRILWVGLLSWRIIIRTFSSAGVASRWYFRLMRLRV